MPCKTAESMPEMTARVELHFHLLPGVDDGPADLADSLELARAAVADGTDTVIVTPHVRSDFVTDVLSLRARVCELSGSLAAAGVPLAIACGGELGHELVPVLRQEELEAIAQGPPGARWLLLEAPWGPFGEDFHAAADELRERGFGVLLAHPERSADAELAGSAGLERELRAGSLAQINALSLTGRHGPGAEAAAFSLLDQGLVALVASDAHGPTRPPALGAARRRLLEHGLDPGAADVLTLTAPRTLLARGLAPRPALAA
jgi:protein-tyrosine phosphatase